LAAVDPQNSVNRIQLRSKRTTGAGGTSKTFERLNVAIFDLKERSMNERRNEYKQEFGKPIVLKPSKTKRALGERQLFGLQA
jgi:hypothetical protein